VAEFFLWFLAVGSFLIFYILGHGASGSVALPHIGLIFSGWLFLVCLRLLNWKLAFDRECSFVKFGCAKCVAVVLWCAPLLMLLSYYVLAVLGLLFWGRVSTWSLVKTYAFQGGLLANVFGVEWWFFVLLLILFFVPFLFIYFFIERLDWTLWGGAKVSWRGLLIILFLAFLLLFVQMFRVSGEVGVHPQEPIGISFFSGGLANLQSHELIVSVGADVDEIKAMKAYERTEKFVARNVVLIVGDALRADHMSLYGYPRVTTPNLEDSTEMHQTFKMSRARSICAESSCGLIAIASSRTMHNFPTRSFTLYEVLRRHGYRVHMALSGDHANFYGLKDAYGKVDTYFDGGQQSSYYLNDDDLLKEYVSSLPDFDGLAPVMFQFHFMSSHGLGQRHKESDVFMPYANYQLWPVGIGRLAPSLAKVPEAVNYYDNGVVQFDRTLHQVLAVLENKGYLKDAVVVITGDHGEMLGEKGIIGHRHRVYEEVLNIPLVVQRRGYEGGGFGKWPMVSQIDVAPTILAELGIHSPEIWQGVALQSPVRHRLLYFQQAQQVGLYDVGVDDANVIKYWRDFDVGKEFVYNVIADGEEFRNILDLIPEDKLSSLRREAASSSLYVQ
jgi:hypothetical protein